MDTQAILIIILSILTVNLVIVGVFVVLVLKDVRELIKRAHDALDGLDTIKHVVSNPLSIFGGVFNALLEGYKAVKDIKDSDSVRSIKD